MLGRAFKRTARAAMTIRARILLWIMEHQPYLWLIKHVIPNIRFSFGYAKLKGKKYREGYKLLKPGHILLSRDHSKLISIMIGGKWCHAAMCVSKDVEGEYEVGEMTRIGYTKSEFFDICHEADRVAIMECTDWDDAYIRDVVIPTCRSYEGVGYDYAFTYGVKILYCSELPWASDLGDRLQVCTGPGKLGRDHISPNGLAEATNGRIIWDSDWE